jgi:dTDP-4-amino-4,6-dideoxygalactose transaminase
MKVPFLDLKAQYETIKGEIRPAIDEVIEKTAFAGGPFVAKFDQEFAAFCGTRHSVGVSSGTEALWIPLLGLGVGPGDEVITVPNSFIATAEAISFCGAKPVFVEVDPRTFTMDPAKLEAAVTPRTKAVIPVHLYGQMADMDPIMAIAKRRGLLVVEDACQAHGAEYQGRRAGSIGDAGAFSFYPGKNLGAYGEGGAVTTNNETLAGWMRAFRDHGSQEKYHHKIIGWNGRLGGIQGAVLSVKLRHLAAWNDARRSRAALYRHLLKDVPGVTLPEEAADRKHVYHLFVIRVADRKGLMDFFASHEIQCGIHYPVPIHLQEAYGSLGLALGSFPFTEKSAGEIVSLPMFAELEDAQVGFVCEKIKAYLGR